MRQRRNTLAVQQQKDEISNRTDSEYYNDHDDHLKSSAHDAPKKNVQSTIIVVTIILQNFALWICSSIVVASANTWVAVPFIGYCRWDFATMLLSVQNNFYLHRTDTKQQTNYKNPHDDGVYRNRVPTNIVPCKKAHDVTTFLIPLTAPEGSGLRDWKKEKNGNVV